MNQTAETVKNNGFMEKIIGYVNAQFDDRGGISAFFGSLRAEMNLKRTAKRLPVLFRTELRERTHDEELLMLSIALFDERRTEALLKLMRETKETCLPEVQIKAEALAIITEHLHLTGEEHAHHHEHAGHEHHGHAHADHSAGNRDIHRLKQRCEALSKRLVQGISPETELFVRGAIYRTVATQGQRQHLKMHSWNVAKDDRRLKAIFHIFFGARQIGGGCGCH